MRILFFGNNWAAWQIIEWLRTQQAEGDEIVGLVLHPDQKRKYGDEILSSAALPPSQVFDGSRLNDPAQIEALRALGAEIGVSVFFGYILRQPILELMPCINLHPAYLPYNRGAYPNVWSIIEDTPAGVTLHYMDVGVDTGDIIAQQIVPVEPVDTGESLYKKLEQASVDLFKQSWPLLRAGRAVRLSQPASAGTTHRVKDVEQIDEIDLDRTYTGRELINLLRARTYPPYASAYFRHDGRKIYLRLNLSYEDQEQQ